MISFRIIFAVMLIAASVVRAPQANAQARAASSEWKVTYTGGDVPLTRGTGFALRVTNYSVNGSTQDKIAFAVSPASVLAIGDDIEQTTLMNRDVWSTILAAGEPCFGTGCGGSNLSSSNTIEGRLAAKALTAAVIGVIALTQRNNSQHYVGIVWREKGREKTIVFRTDESTRTAIRRQLQLVTGKPWQDFPELRRRLIEQIERDTSLEKPILLERAMNLAGKRLPAARYDLHLIEGNDGRGEIFLLTRGQSQRRTIAAQAAVEIEKAATPQPSPAVRSVTTAHVETITEILLPEKILRVIAKQ